MADGALTTTAYIILGLLTTRDWSAYELAEQVGRGVDHLWGRAVRQRYTTVTQLAARGLVSAREEGSGRRPRTVYSLTPEGREALAAWLRTDPPTQLSMEFEAMVRVLVAEQGTTDDLRASILAVREQAVQTLTLFEAHAQLMLATGGTFPERLHLFALVNRFMVGHGENLLAWADWALDHVETWPDTRSPAVDDVERSRQVLLESAARARRALDAGAERRP